MADASVLVTALLDQGQPGARARECLSDDVAVPELADVEVLSAVRRRVLADLLPVARGAAVLSDYAALTLDRYPHALLLPRAWELRNSVTAYDAQYVALAELLGVKLATADVKLAAAPGLRCAVDLLR